MIVAQGGFGLIGDTYSAVPVFGWILLDAERRVIKQGIYHAR